MKNYIYICVAAALGLGAVSCNDMDLEPKGILSENTLLNSDEGIKRYLALQYQDLPIEDFNYGQNGDQVGYGSDGGHGWHGSNKWQAQKSSPASAAQEAVGRATSYGGGWGYWPYGRIHDINNFLEQLPNYSDNMTEQQYEEYVAEGRFLRAFYYFGIVKRYGGVPLIDKTLNPTDPYDEIAYPRSTEYDSWKFIYDDLKYAMEHGSKEVVGGRANRYAAAALMSRAMLYAGTVAKYSSYIVTTGEATSLGLMGMKIADAAEFYGYVLDACKMLEDAGFKLHDGADKEKAFVEVFTESCPEEDIFVKQYTERNDNSNAGTMLFHNWDVMVLPFGSGLSSFVGCAIQPTWELMSLYEHPALEDEDGKPVRFDDISDFWNTDEMEPRARATFFFSGMTEPLSGVTFDMLNGVYTSYPGTVADGTTELPRSTNEYTAQYRRQSGNNGLQYEEINGVRVKISGTHTAQAGGDEGFGYTGAFIRKYIGTKDIGERAVLLQSTTPFKVFRYGEVLCNWAEAAYELGDLNSDNNLKQEAIDKVNELRRRAGAHEYTYNPSAMDIGTAKYGFKLDENLQYIRDERTRELAYENHHIFDIRRWRVADEDFKDGKYSHTLSAYYVMDEGKYIFLNEVDKEGRKVTFNKQWYYEQIPGGAIANNNKLIRNDGY